MKPRTACDNCRKRHTNCRTIPGSSVCRNCRAAGRDCNFTPAVHFRSVQFPGRSRKSAVTVHVAPRTIQPARLPETSPEVTTTSFDPGLKIPTSAEPPSAERSVVAVPSSTPGTENENLTPGSTQTDHSHQSPIAGGKARDTTKPRYRRPSSAAQVAADSTFAGQHSGPSSHSNTLSTTTSPELGPGEFRSLLAENSAPGASEHSHKRISRFGIDIRDGEIRQIMPSRRETNLLKLFMEKIVGWADAWDESRPFATSIPSLAFQEPMIMNAVLAVAARFESKLKGDTGELEASMYHGRCLEFLISAINKPPEAYSESLLVGVVIAQIYQELDVTPRGHETHVIGTSRIVDHAAATGLLLHSKLAAASGWVHLRQAIALSLYRNTRIQLNLSNFDGLVAYSAGATAYTNQITLIFAKTLRLYFPDENKTREPPTNGYVPANSVEAGIKEWNDLEEQVEHWYRSKPEWFGILYYREQDLADNRPFPEYLISTSCQVSGFIHYHASKLMLALYEANRARPRLAFEGVRARLNIERSIGARLCAMMGIALYNQESITAMYLTSRMLVIGGYCIRHALERERTVEFLEKHGLFPSLRPQMIQALTSQWHDLDELEGRIGSD